MKAATRDRILVWSALAVLVAIWGMVFYLGGGMYGP